MSLTISFMRMVRVSSDYYQLHIQHLHLRPKTLIDLKQTCRMTRLQFHVNDPKRLSMP